SLYGLKQAPRAWFQRFAAYAARVGFHHSRCDSSLFIYRQGADTAYLLLYVDDIVLTASSSDLLQQIITSLHAEFSMTDLGSLNYFLGISVTRNASGMFLSQQKYATEVLDRAGMLNCKPCRTPVDTDSKLSADGAPISDSTLYRSLAGALQYLTFTRPDISYAVQQVCLFMHDPREPHLSALKRILRYVRGTLSYGLQLYSSTTSSLVAYSDADWAGCPTTRRSTSGYCVFLGNNLLSWSSKRQFTLSRSSAEAEYRGVANAVAETCWLRNLLRELHTPLATATLVYCDNVSAVYLSSNPVQHQRTKHIEIDIHFVRDLVATGAIRVLHVPSRYQYADIFTKGLPTSLFDEFRTSLSVRSSPVQTAGECSSLKRILDDTCADVESGSSDFGVMVAALKEFIANEGGGEAPLEGSIPDMTSSTELYINLQKLYQAKAEADFIVVEQRVRDILKKVGRDPYSISKAVNKGFCKNARKLTVCKYRPIEEEFNSLVFPEMQKYLTDEEYSVAVGFYILLRAVDRFAANYNTFPGQFDAMGFRFQNSLQSKIDQTSKISKSVFISNFPDDCSSRDLWKVCNGYGTVVDVFIPNKRSKAGKRFAFVRFINVLNLDRLIENLKTIWIGRFHLSANTARFERPKASTFQKEKPVPSGNVTGFKQPIVQNQGRPKESYSSILKPSLVLDDSCLVNRDLTNCVMGEVLQFSSINNLQVLLSNEGFHNTRVVYLGGLWVMIELKSSKSKSKFMEHVGVASWFRRLCNAQSDFAAKERIVWVDIEGVPLNAWTRSTFQKISSKWGELVELEDGYDDLFARKRICIKTSQTENILESFKLIVKGKVFWARAKELFVWSPSFKDVPEKELFSDDESAKINEQANNLNNDEVENASEVVSDTYFGDNGEVQGFEHQHGESNDKEVSSDPFNIYDLLDKRTKEVRTTDTSTSIPYPPGFTPANDIPACNNQDIPEAESDSPDVASVRPTSKSARRNSSPCQSIGLSSRVMEDTGQTMRFSMDGCLKDMEIIIGSQGDREGFQ
ncbi:ribonuclease H-like domain-containing protein, partial [Tanacetum coccineum]